MCLRFKNGSNNQGGQSDQTTEESTQTSDSNAKNKEASSPAKNETQSDTEREWHLIGDILNRMLILLYTIIICAILFMFFPRHQNE